MSPFFLKLFNIIPNINASTDGLMYDIPDRFTNPLDIKAKTPAAIIPGTIFFSILLLNMTIVNVIKNNLYYWIPNFSIFLLIVSNNESYP